MLFNNFWVVVKQEQLTVAIVVEFIFKLTPAQNFTNSVVAQFKYLEYAQFHHCLQ